MPVKNRLKKIRHEMEIDTQIKMAEKLGLNQQQYNRYENQQVQPDIETAFRIAQKLNITVDELFIYEPGE